MLAVFCAQLEAIDNGDISQPGTAYVNDVARYTCNTGYNMTSGSQTRTCSQQGSSGSWSGSQPRCRCKKFVSACSAFKVRWYYSLISKFTYYLTCIFDHWHSCDISRQTPSAAQAHPVKTVPHASINWTLIDVCATTAGSAPTAKQVYMDIHVLYRHWSMHVVVFVLCRISMQNIREAIILIWSNKWNH